MVELQAGLTWTLVLVNGLVSWSDRCICGKYHTVLMMVYGLLVILWNT